MQPPFLTKGDTVGIVAPARKLDKDMLTKAKVILEGWGLKVKVGRHVGSQEHSYLSALDEHRREDLQTMLDDRRIRAIFCARGGYGSTRILDSLSFDKFIDAPKWIIGFSDITSIHLMLNKLKMQSLHATMPVLFSTDDQQSSVFALRDVLFGKLEVLLATSSASNKVGIAKGELVGGNLSLIVDSLGTSNEIQTENKILILEEVGEYYYRIDRMFMQLKRANKLSSLAGLAIGYFSDITETTLPFGETIPELIRHHTAEHHYPIAFNFPIGHHQPNMPFVQGAKASMIVNQEGSILSYNNDLISE